MSIHIIIDGYNLIRCGTLFREDRHQSLEMERESLITSLVAYKKLKRHKITVVFDGTHAPVIYNQRDRVKGITIVFSRPGELADAVIKRMAASERNRGMIVTSDREIASYARSVGASCIGADEFEEKLMLATYFDLKGMDEETDSKEWKPTTRKKGPKRRLPKSKRQTRLKLKKL